MEAYPEITHEPFGAPDYGVEKSHAFNAFCEREDVRAMAGLLIKRVVDVINLGVRIIVDEEPMLYESVFTALAIIAHCANTLAESNVVRNINGEPTIINFSLFGRETGRMVMGGEVIDVYIKTLPSPERVKREIEELVDNLNKVFFYVERGKPEADLTTVYYYRGLIPTIVKEAYQRLYKITGEERWLKKIKYIGRVPLDAVIRLPPELLERATAWRPPPPPYTSLFDKDVSGLRDLVIPRGVRSVLERFLIVAQEEGRGSILLLGLPASGRKTIGVAIAKELGLPVYRTTVVNFLASYVGKSEERMRAMFSALKTRGGVLLFENVELLFKKRTGEGVTSNLRNILISEMTSPDMNYVVVFTSTHKVEPEILDTPIIGQVKVVIPPPTMKERRILAERFLRKIAGPRWDRIVEAAMRSKGFSREKAERYLVSTYGNPIADVAVGLTSGELYLTMKMILVPAFKRILETGRLVSIDREIQEFARLDYPTRQGKLAKLREIAGRLMYMEIVDDLKKIEEEVRKKAVEVKRIIGVSYSD